MRLTQALQAISLLLLAFVAGAALIFTILCALGLAPWLTFVAQFGDMTLPQAGMITQIGLTFLLCSLFFFMPMNGRILALEQSHRKFHVSMTDVAHAYHLCHTADRAGVFTLSSEFDSVRERLAYLRDHPDLPQLETDVLTVAAQMSQQARHLADVYSDEKVARAKAFLAERQEEAEAQQARIVEALHACREIRKWVQQIELEESVVASQLAQLDEQLQAALPALGYSFEGFDADKSGKLADNVVSLPTPKAAAE
jgi:hypothetical protein